MQSAARRSDGPLLPAAQRAELLRGVFIVLEPAACNTKKRHRVGRMVSEWKNHSQCALRRRSPGSLLPAENNLQACETRAQAHDCCKASVLGPITRLTGTARVQMRGRGGWPVCSSAEVVLEARTCADRFCSAFRCMRSPKHRSPTVTDVGSLPDRALSPAGGLLVGTRQRRQCLALLPASR